MEREEIKKQIGKNIFYNRRQKRIKQKDLAGIIGKSSSYLCDIEKGRSMPSLIVIYKIAESMDIDISELLKNI